MSGASVGRIAGVVLAGGLSRRMGRDKAGVLVRGRSLMARTCDRLAPQCARLAISRHAGGAHRSGLAYPTIADGIAGHAGPLAGILAALDWSAADDPTATHVVTVAVDTPFLPFDLVTRLVAARDGRQLSIACAMSGGRIHPVAALWPVAIRGALRTCVAVDEIRRVTTILDRFGFATAEWPSEPYDPFFNVNTPEDAVRAGTMAAALDRRSAQ